MTKTPLSQNVVCPKCGCKQPTFSPRCQCHKCYAVWRTPWKLTSEEFWSFNSSKKSQTTIARLAEQAGLDAKAVNILFNTEWDLDGEGNWIEFTAPKEELSYAKAAGVMQADYKLAHDALITKTIEARDKLDRREVAAAFVVSLPERRMDLRSALGSYASVLHLAPHAHTAKKGKGCQICDADKEERIDVNHSTFRRLMWAGNVHQTMPGYVLCDLLAFPATKPAQAKPDRGLLKRILDAIRGLPATAGLAELEKSLAGLFPSNKSERQVVLEILGYCGILKPKDFPSSHVKWIPRDDYPEPKHFFRKEWRSPVSCWTGEDGVHEPAVKFWFGDL